MADVWLAIVNRWLEKRFNIKGGPTVVDLDPRVQPVIQVSRGNEDRYLEGWYRYGIGVQQTAVAGQFGAIRLSNHAGSGLIGVVENWNVNEAAADSPIWDIQIGAPDLATPIPPSRLDARQGSTANTGLFLSIGSAAAQTGNVVRKVNLTASVGTIEAIGTLNQEMVILPGDSVTLWAGTVNQLISCSITWRERALETSELA